MSKQKNKCSVCRVENSKGYIIGYLSNRDIEQGVDISLAMQGFTIIAI